MKLNQQLAQELDLTYWRLKTEGEEPLSQTACELKEEELTLLKNILKSIQIHFNREMLSEQNGVLNYQLKDTSLIFDNVDLTDTMEVIHLAKLDEMNIAPELKKKTWFKLKKRFL
jgi:DNA polymerase III psi subunit